MPTDNNKRLIIQRVEDKIYLVSKNVNGYQFFIHPVIEERLDRSIQSYSDGKAVELSDGHLKDLFGI